MVAPDLAGELKVTVRARDGCVRQALIESTRPQLANRLLAGKPAAEAVAMVPQLFAICGRSQHVAAELARIACGEAPAAPLAGSVQLGAGRGLGWVETARGLLLHQIDLDGGTVRRYRIVAPTEWNFHPQGALAAATVGVRETSAGQLARRTEWLLQSLDPCVAYQLEVEHA